MSIITFKGLSKAFEASNERFLKYKFTYVRTYFCHRYSLIMSTHALNLPVKYFLVIHKYST